MNQENSTGFQEQAVRPVSNKRAGSRNKHNAKKRMLRILVSAGVLLLFVGIICLRGCSEPSPVAGVWDLDGITSYEFKDNGKGKMILPSSEYQFKYDIEGELLRIDFEYEGARDAEYLFTATEDKLVLDGGNSFTRGVYILTKQN